MGFDTNLKIIFSLGQISISFRPSSSLNQANMGIPDKNFAFLNWLIDRYTFTKKNQFFNRIPFAKVYLEFHLQIH